MDDDLYLKQQKQQRFDVSLVILIGTNLLFGFYYILSGGSVIELMWVFWAQSVIIGVINFFRILTQREYSVKGLKINGRQAERNETEKRNVAIFFLFHYGIFHGAYMMFLLQQGPLELNRFIVFGVLIFVINHTFSFLYNYRVESLVSKNIGHLMFYPYVRIIPMHATIIFAGSMVGGLGTMVLLSFIGLKTFADAMMHYFEHKIFRR